MLDYIEPKDITKFKFPTLKNNNLFVSDFFDLENEFNSKIKNRNIDFILGNPPWRSNSEKKHLEYIKNN
jgi:methylase of polypeptide subunit release factors